MLCPSRTCQSLMIRSRSTPTQSRKSNQMPNGPARHRLSARPPQRRNPDAHATGQVRPDRLDPFTWGGAPPRKYAMTTWIRKSTAIFTRPFTLDGFEGRLPAGTYQIESEQDILEGMFLPDCLRTSVLIHLHATAGSPALAQTLTIPWEVLERAQIRDQAPAERPSDLPLDHLLADPTVRLVMFSDGVSEAEVRRVAKAARALNPLRSSFLDSNGRARLKCRSRRPLAHWITRCDREKADWRATDRGENEGMALLSADT